MKRLILTLAISFAAALSNHAATIATFTTPVGSWEVELFDDKPVTVSNFLKYAASGRYENQLIHRWVPGFVIQGGGYRVDTSNPEQYNLISVPTYGTITNEAHVGTFRSNLYGTIAMARVGGQTNSATSQWFINLDDNSDLDDVDNGFTVFGRVIAGTNNLNKFFPPPPAHQIYFNHSILGTPMPVLTTNPPSWLDLMYVDLTLRRDMNVSASTSSNGSIAWDSVAGVTNSVDYSTSLSSPWVNYTNVIGTGARLSLPETSADPHRFYRVRLRY